MTAPSVGAAWPGLGALVTSPYNPQFDLNEAVGQRVATYAFALTDGITGEILGDLAPIRPAQLTHDTSRVIKRELSFSLGRADTAAIDPVRDRVSPFMLIGNNAYPLGRYMFADDSRQKFTSGDLGTERLYDEMFRIDQQIEQGLTGAGRPTVAVIAAAMAGIDVHIEVEASPYSSVESWAIGAHRGSQVLEALSVTGDFWSPWLDNTGVLRFQRTFDPALRVPDIDLDRWPRVERDSIMHSSDLLTAPNVFIITSNAANDPNQPVVGRAAVPNSAPNSVVNRGFAIPDVRTLQLADGNQATAVAQGLAQRQTIAETVTLNTPPDPRHDSYNVIRWDGANWLEIAWSLTLLEGEPMAHVMRKSYDPS